MVTTGPLWLLKLHIPVPQPGQRQPRGPVVAQGSPGNYFCPWVVWVVMGSYPVISGITKAWESLWGMYPVSRALPSTHKALCLIPSTTEARCGRGVPVTLQSRCRGQKIASAKDILNYRSSRAAWANELFPASTRGSQLSVITLPGAPAPSCDLWEHQANIHRHKNLQRGLEGLE